MITITKGRLLTIKQWRETYGPGSNVVLPAEEAEELARIALVSLEAEPVAKIIAHYPLGVDVGKQKFVQAIGELPDFGGYLFAAPPAPVSVPAAMEIDDDFDSAFEHGKAVGWNAYRAAMLQSGNFRENKNSSTNNFREIAETSTNYPVIPSEVLSAIQKVAKIRADFDDFDGDRRGIGDCLDEAEQELIVTINKYASQLAAEPIAPNDVREQTAIPQVPVTPDDWISCSERMPDSKTGVLVAREFGRKGDWRMKWATYIPWHPDTNDGWLIPGASWKPSHWMPLPEPPL
ncbi:DUF551 domain-containing protein [Salmonella enterica subsp. enterica]|nr:DUF551 domain-containing protein [Salmonella enterica subsp. enterica serovar Schwarzengrund]